MTEPQNAPLLDATTAQKAAERRRFLQLAGGASIAAGGLSLLAACGGDDGSPTPSPTPTPTGTPTPTPTTTSNVDQQALNYALQLEYLQAQFYAYATTGAGVSADLLTGTGTPGAATGGNAVPFADELVGAAAREIAEVSRARIAWIRAILTTESVAQPAINLSGGADGAFTAIARTAGIVSATGVFNPYADDESFLLGAFLLQDVIVTAYKGLVALINTVITRAGIVGITAAHSYHAGWLRTSLYARGTDAQSKAGLLSDARDALDGANDIDQPIVVSGAANITPADGNGIAYSRSSGQVLNVLYLNKAEATSGGFFPAGFNGDLKTSVANA